MYSGNVSFVEDVLNHFPTYTNESKPHITLYVSLLDCESMSLIFPVFFLLLPLKSEEMGMIYCFVLANLN